MYQFEDNYRYSIYSMDGNFGGLEDAGNSPNPYTVENDIITIDLFFGNIVNYQMNYICDGQVVEFIYNEIIHSTLFREGYNYIEDNCEEYLENCCEQADIATDNCEGVGCYIPQCSEDCTWESMQCWGSTGYCWCVDENGIEIEGTSMPSWEGFPDCEEYIEECFDFTDIDFGACTMVLGVGLLNNECSYISGCDWIINDIDYSDLFFDSIDNCEASCNNNQCEAGFVEINDLCFHEGDIEVLQKLIDNSVNSGINDDCDPYDPYCGSPNPYMDQEDAWFWVVVDSVYYQSGTGNGFQNANGQVDPLELGLQEWEDGRLISLMCGAYIYCQLSGPIPEEIGNLSEISVLRLEYNYLSGFIPETICDLNTNNSDYLEFDLTGNYLCPPYPECISTSGFWSQDTSSCSEIGDINFDSIINILDIIVLISFILEENYPDYQEFIISDINLDGSIDVLDVVEVLNIILN